MKLIRVAAAALNQTPLDWDANAENIRRAIDVAREREVQILCLPELSITGYGCEDAFFSHAVGAMAEQVLRELLGETRGMAVSFGLPLLVGVAAKQRLAGDGLHYEPRWFKPWPAGHVATIRLAGHECQVGELLFEVDGIRIGFEICEDAWVADRPGDHLMRRGVDLILNPSASHFAFGKYATRQQLVVESSRTFGVAYVYSNLVGNEAGRVIYDGQTLIAANGELITSGPRLTMAPATVIDAVIDVDAVRMRRSQSASFQPAIEADEVQQVAPIAFSFRQAAPEVRKSAAASWENSDSIQEEEFTRAIALGLFDYLRKSHARGFVVSLSGGADSAAVASLVAIMVKLGIAEFGVGGFAAMLGLPASSIPADDAAGRLTARLLTTAYQSTRQSSATTRSAAATVARAIGATHYELDVDDVCQSYTAKVEAALGRRLQWTSDDVTLQNIQARARGPSVWMLANVNNALLLATSNRSEAAVGYATMDGDTCGGISPIAGIDKAFLRRWLRWLEHIGPEGIGPIPELSVVNALQPTAELRPAANVQTDESDLMPYDLLDAVEHQAIGEKRSPAEVLAFIAAEFPQYDRPQLAAWIRRFFELWSRNQWKRERYAPSFHVDDKNLDPKTWCRFPILSGGFRRELRELDSHQ